MQDKIYFLTNSCGVRSLPVMAGGGSLKSFTHTLGLLHGLFVVGLFLVTIFLWLPLYEINLVWFKINVELNSTEN